LRVPWYPLQECLWAPSDWPTTADSLMIVYVEGHAGQIRGARHNTVLDCITCLQSWAAMSDLFPARYGMCYP